MRVMVLFVVAASMFAAVVLTACGEGGDKEEPTYLSGKSGCMHFANVHTDLADGVLSDAEFRSKIKEVYESLRHAEPVLAGKARALIRSINAVPGHSIQANRVIAISVRQPLNDMVDACLAVLEMQHASQ